MEMKMTGLKDERNRSWKGLFLFFLLISSFSVHGQLPLVNLKDIDGKSINAAGLSNDGKPFIISFFALWCKPCLRELNAIQEFYADWQKETGVKVIAVSIDEGHNSNKVGPAVNGFGWDFDILLDPNREFMRKMNVTTIPCLFIFDGNNKIVMRKSSYTDGSEMELIEEIRKVMKKK